jgi:hypothetical protein
VAVSGGFRTTVGGLRISLRSPLPLAIISMAVFAIWYVSARREKSIASDLGRVWVGLNQHSKFVAATALVAVFMTGVFATRSAAGADASGYISESAMMSSGPLVQACTELAGLFGAATMHILTAAGMSRLPGTIGRRPTYPQGLPLLMAAPARESRASAAYISCRVLAARHRDHRDGLLAFQLAEAIVPANPRAAFIRVHPVYIHQSIQP